VESLHYLPGCHGDNHKGLDGCGDMALWLASKIYRPAGPGAHPATDPRRSLCPLGHLRRPSLSPRRIDSGSELDPEQDPDPQWRALPGRLVVCPLYY
jgi:hypothetical protein